MSILSTLRVHSPHTITPRHIRGEDINFLYNPLVGADIISAQLALALLCVEPLTPTNQSFKDSFGLILERIGVLQNVTVKHDSIGLY